MQMNINSLSLIDLLTIMLAGIDIVLVVLIIVLVYFGLSQRGEIEKVLKGGIVKEELENLMQSKLGEKMLDEATSRKTANREKDE